MTSVPFSTSLPNRGIASPFRIMATSGNIPAANAKYSIQNTASVNGTVQPSDDMGFHLPDIPLWTRWALLSLLSFAIPFYKNVLRTEDNVEQVAETLVEDAEKVAKVVQKVATEIADVLPKDCIVEDDFVMIEHIAEEVIEVADKAEAFIQKVDIAKEALEEKLEPYIEKGEEIVNGKA